MPQIVILAGPNGAGKTTASVPLLRDQLGMFEFVNADAIAAGLSPFDPASVAMQAGRLMLQRLDELADAGRDFALETTLATRTYRPWLLRRMADGYAVTLFFFWLPSPDLAIKRVASRVRVGGHAIEDAVVRRRYTRGLVNFFTLYRPIVSDWAFYDNTLIGGPKPIAESNADGLVTVHNADLWRTISAEHDHADQP